MKNEKSFHILPWPFMVVRNCDDEGELINFKTVTEFKKQNQPLWLLLKLLFFWENGNKIYIFHCSDCHQMKGIDDFQTSQTDGIMKQFQCIHSLAAGKLLADAEENWDLRETTNRTSTEYSVAATVTL